MTSCHQAAANRRNARASTGPTSAEGKAKASRNALRHGLEAIKYREPKAAEDIRNLADMICPPGSDPLRREQALIVAECTATINRIRERRLSAINELRSYRAPTEPSLEPVISKPIGRVLASHDDGFWEWFEE